MYLHARNNRDHLDVGRHGGVVDIDNDGDHESDTLNKKACQVTICPMSLHLIIPDIQQQNRDRTKQPSTVTRITLPVSELLFLEAVARGAD